MKKLIVIFLCLTTVCCLFTSCSARMTRPEFPTDGRNAHQDITGIFPDEWTDGSDSDGSIGSNTNGNAGDYTADKDGKVRSYNSDNNFSF